MLQWKHSHTYWWLNNTCSVSFMCRSRAFFWCIIISCVTRVFQFAMGMFSRSIQANKSLYGKNKPVMVTSARTNDNHFHVSLTTYHVTRMHESYFFAEFDIVTLGCVFFQQKGSEIQWRVPIDSMQRFKRIIYESIFLNTYILNYLAALPLYLTKLPGVLFLSFFRSYCAYRKTYRQTDNG